MTFVTFLNVICHFFYSFYAIPLQHSKVKHYEIQL